MNDILAACHCSFNRRYIEELHVKELNLLKIISAESLDKLGEFLGILLVPHSTSDLIAAMLEERHAHLRSHVAVDSSDQYSWLPRIDDLFRLAP